MPKITRIILVFSAFFLLKNIAAGSHPDVRVPPKMTGFPCANFGIAAEVSPSGRLLGRIMYNPPIQGEWLENLAAGRFSFGTSKYEIQDEDFEGKKIDRSWPFAKVKFEDKRLIGFSRIGKFSIRALFFAPIKANDPFITSLPVIMGEITIVNGTKTEVKDFSVNFYFKGETDGEYKSFYENETQNLKYKTDHGFTIFHNGFVMAGFNGAAITGEENGIFTIRKKIKLLPNSQTVVKFIFANFNENGYYTNYTGDVTALARYVYSAWNKLKKATQEFSENLPDAGDEKLNEYLRWYMTAGIMLTKITKGGEVLTMGYTELNQRDSFWTSFLHLVYWRELERKMIEESAAHQNENGKIPTTILPTIERGDDIDINEYFILRVFRYYEATKDIKFLQEMWFRVIRAVEFLKGLDKDGDGIPDQGSFWADWKDVDGVQGRKYSPYFSLLWLAVLKKTYRYGSLLGDVESFEKYKKLFDIAYIQVNKSINDGGLWNGDYYVNVWYNGWKDSHLLEDQTVGILFGVVDAEKAAKIYASLERSKCRWGIRETYPYYPDTFGYKGGDYHNGAVWPYLNFVDSFSRFKAGKIDDAIWILKTVGWADLERDGDFLPHENIDGETGENSHHFIQAWDSVYFAAIYFGLLGKSD